MKIIKRDQSTQSYDEQKICMAIQKAAKAVSEELPREDVQDICNVIYQGVHDKVIQTVEQVQDCIEEELMKHQYFKTAKAYILYREKRTQMRIQYEQFLPYFQCQDILSALKEVQQFTPEDAYSLSSLYMKFSSFYKEGMKEADCLQLLIKASTELIGKEAPKWEFIAARFLSVQLHGEIRKRMKEAGLSSFYEKIVYLTAHGWYGDYILEAYSKEELNQIGAMIQEERDAYFTYSGLELIKKRYLICNHVHEPMETPQEMFMGIAMHLALKEKDRMRWVKEFYDMLSTLKVTMATPTMANARKPFHQLSSCFIDTVEDSLSSIYKSLDNFAQVSKFGGGMGLYFGKVRAMGSDIRGFDGVAGGIIRWIKLVNDTATAVDQLGVRQGAVAVYLDVWHRDLPQFLQLRTNNGDDRQKAHDVFPAVCYPDLFWRLAQDSLDHMWYLMDPHEILVKKGYALEDSFGEEWERKYWDCVHDQSIQKVTIQMRELVRLILKSAVETGTPFVFNRDIVNRMNPNPHKGMIYCSNLCTEIAQNMSAMEKREQTIEIIDGEQIVVDKTKAGNFVVCNLASLVLGNIDITDKAELSHIIHTTIRALDNVIDLNFYPLPYAQITNQQYRSIGLGTSGYHHMLAKQGIPFESEEHLQFIDALYEEISYYSIEASEQLAQEKGTYTFFSGSDWESGTFFDKRGYNDERWNALRKLVKQHGMRNAYLLAIAPTSSTSIIAGTSAAVDPIMNKFFLEEKKGGMIMRVAPDLNPKTFWLYKNAHLIDQAWIVKAAGIRQRHIDQAQSVNLYITNEYTLRQVLNLYIDAWRYGVKTIYYVRSKALEVEECESCSA